MRQAGAGRTAWSEDLLDGASFRLAEQAARAAGLPLEAWLERAIRRACAGRGETTVLPPGAAIPGTAGEEVKRRGWGGLAALLVPPLLLLIAGFAFLAAPPAGRGVRLALPPATTTVALPSPAPSAPPAGAVEPSDPKALAQWLAPRAESGDAVAQYRLGTLYALGKGVDKDYARAAPLLRAAAESGLAEAEYDYGVLCENGYGVARDAVEALAWYRKAAAQGNASAALALGYAYAKGIGGERDMGDAAQWFRRAAELGLVDAQYNLAFLYEHGEGVAKSEIDAYAWYTLAASSGDAGAARGVERLGKTLTAQQVKAAEARVAELRKSLRP
jgi:hypothetical protein